MLERMLAGVVIGLVVGGVLGRDLDAHARSVAIGFFAAVAVAFVGSSWLYGAVYGAMAVGELCLGYLLSRLVPSSRTLLRARSRER
ncbi:hypothetical protein MRB56_08580 [Halomonas cupida]|uniref:hypothetical protein n=1 Tax=Halomonas cupida TaxID=44933 RepID=UPI0039B36F2F